MNAAYLREALDLAGQGRGQTSPNPMVGAVLVRDGEVVGRGFHTYAGVKHAEIVALEQAGDRARGAALYINLEPCSHHGRTPPCADALIQAGVTDVVAAMEDPNPLVSERGFRASAGSGDRGGTSPPSSPLRRRGSTNPSSISCAPAGRW